MSSRWYPIYQRGNPQLRVFLPNFWMKIVKVKNPQAPNVVPFEVSMGMTKLDVKNYLEKIYKLPVVDVRTRIAIGKTRRAQVGGYIVKDEDSKMAYVTFPKEVNFTFPDLFPENSESKKQIKEDEKSMDLAKDRYKEFLERNKNRRDVPGWFSL